MKRILLLVSIILVLASTSFAGLMLDVTLTNGTRDLTLAPGTTTAVAFQLWAVVTGTDANVNNDGIYDGYANLLVTNAGLTNVVGLGAITRSTVWKGAGSSNSTSQDLNGDGIKDSGSTGNAATGQFHFTSTLAPDSPDYGDGPNSSADGQPYSGGGMKYLLGTFSMTFGPGGVGGAGTLSVNAAVPTFAGVPKGIWFQDNPNYQLDATANPGDPNGPSDAAFKIVSTGSGLSVGSGVHVTAVPEPATLVLLGMSALALVFIRRRK